MQYQFAIEDKKYTVEIGAIKDGRVEVNVNDELYHVAIDNPDQLDPGQHATRPAGGAPPLPSAGATPRPQAVQPNPAPSVASAAPAATAAGNGVVTAPIPGLILDVKVTKGGRVSVGQTVVTMEAMKMENQICATVAGTVQEVRVEKGTAVGAGDVIMVIG